MKVYTTIARYSHIVTMLCVLGCSNDSSNNRDSIDPPPPPVINPIPAKLSAQAIEERKLLASDTIDEIVNYNSEVNCPSMHPDCETQTVNFSDGSFDSSKGRVEETILIIDSGLEFLATTRYRSRVVNLYEFEKQGGLSEYDPAIEIPIYLNKILKRLDGYLLDGSISDNSAFIPAMWFAPLVDDFKSESETFNNYVVEHGVLPFNFLMEHNPNAMLVAINEENLFSKFSDELCNSNIDGFKENITKASEEIRRIINDHDIRYVNASWGYTKKLLTGTWDALCTGQPSMDTALANQYIDAMDVFYEALFNHPGVLAVQATDNNMSVDNNKLDITTKYSNRIRVGAYNTLDSEITETGELKENANYPLLPNSHPSNNIEWIDIFINFGFITPRPFPHNNSPLMEYDVFALTSFPISYIHPSWAAPAALSRAIHLKNTRYPNAEMTNEIIQKIKADMTPAKCSDWDLQVNNESTCKIQDPLFHQQAEIFRLGYLGRLDV